MADTYCHSIWIDLGQFEAVKHPRSSNGLVILQVGIQAVFSYLSQIYFRICLVLVPTFQVGLSQLNQS